MDEAWGSPRNPNRIERMLELLRDVWERHPDLRLGQIVSNATPRGVDPFYAEDDVMEAALRRMAEGVRA